MSEITYDAAKRKVWKDPAEIALATPADIHDRTIRAWEFLEEIRGWRTAT